MWNGTEQVEPMSRLYPLSLKPARELAKSFVVSSESPYKSQLDMNLSRGKIIGANLSWLVLIRVFQLLVGVVVLGAVGRYLGPEQFGLLNYAISLTVIFGAFATLGMDGIVIRDLVRSPDKSDVIMGTAFFLRIGGGLVAIALVFLAVVATGEPAAVRMLAIIGSLSLIPNSLSVLELWFQKSVEAKYTVIARIVAVVMSSALRLLLVYHQVPLVWFAVMHIVEALLVGVALLSTYNARGRVIRTWKFDVKVAKALLRDSWPLAASGFLISAYLRVEQILVKAQLGDYEAGVYFSASRIAEVWAFIPFALLSTLYPILVADRAGNPERFKARIQFIFDLLTGMGFLIAVAMTLLGPYLLPFIFGEKFRAAVPILVIQAWTAPIAFNASTRAQCMMLEGQTIFHTPVVLIGIVVNITAALFLMTQIGAMGAAVAVLLSSTVTGYVTSFIFRPLRAYCSVQTKSFLLPLRLRSFLGSLKKLR